MPRKTKTTKTEAVAPVEGAVTEPAPPPAPPRTPEQFNLALRRKVRLFYDIQEMRLSAGGRLLKKSPKNPIELHPDDLTKLKARVQELEAAEKHALRDVADHLEEVPFYRDVIKADRKRWRGIGPTMAGVILSSFDIAREDTPSKMWAFAGLAPVAASRCKACSTVVEPLPSGDFKHPKPQGCTCTSAGKTVTADTVFASGKAARPVAGEKLTYNKWLRTKLCGVLGPVLLQLKSPYREYYDNYKNRKASAGWGRSDAHRHAASIRYMIKMLLKDIWLAWREFLKLPIRPSYQEQYLGHTHQGGLKALRPEPGQTYTDDDGNDLSDQVAAALADGDDVMLDGDVNGAADASLQ